ncbi:hypothetical protein ED312_06855, partial [Sinomicrobium pectinilyticum]
QYKMENKFKNKGELIIEQFENIKWKDFPGAPEVKYFDVEGTISSPGPFIARVKMPAGYKAAMHEHSAPFFERNIVISGVMHLGIGAEFDESKGVALGAGAIAVIPPGVKHYSWNDVETVIHVHGEGPWVPPEFLNSHL